MQKVANTIVWAATLAEARSLARHRAVWSALLIVGFVIGLAGPFGTYDTFAVPVRTAYWMVIALTTFWIGYLGCFIVTTLVEHYGIDGFFGLWTGAVIAALPVTAWIAAVHLVVFGTAYSPGFTALLPYTIVICLAVATSWDGLAGAAVTTASDDSAQPEPRWLDQ